MRVPVPSAFIAMTVELEVTTYGSEAKDAREGAADGVWPHMEAARSRPRAQRMMLRAKRAGMEATSLQRKRAWAE